MAEQQQECIFCAIIAGKVPAGRIYEDSTTIAFLDINPRNPGHTLVIPKKHVETIMDMGDQDVGRLFEVVRRLSVAVKTSMNADGVSITQSNYRAAGQVVPHVHVHIIPRFNSEGPPSLESILGVKKLPDDVSTKIAGTIKEAVGKAGATVYEEKKSDEPKKKKKSYFDEL